MVGPYGGTEGLVTLEDVVETLLEVEIVDEVDDVADLRAADPFRQGGGKGFTKADRSRFLDALERELRAAARQ